MEERRKSAEMTIEDKLKSLYKYCDDHKCFNCPLNMFCDEFGTRQFKYAADITIDKLYKEYILKPQCEINLKKAEAKRGLRAETPVLNEYIFAEDCKKMEDKNE